MFCMKASEKRSRWQKSEARSYWLMKFEDDEWRVIRESK